MQITRAQYQNGLLASRLDSTPQSPEGSHSQLDKLTALPPVTPPGTRNPLPLATPPVKRLPNNAQPTTLGGRAALTSYARRPSQPLVLVTSPANNHTSLSQINPHQGLPSKPQQSPPSAGPENGSEETTTLLSEQQNCFSPHRPSHTISHAHTESTI